LFLSSNFFSADFQAFGILLLFFFFLLYVVMVRASSFV
jgi:hypothetical protein